MAPQTDLWKPVTWFAYPGIGDDRTSTWSGARQPRKLAKDGIGLAFPVFDGIICRNYSAFGISSGTWYVSDVTFALSSLFPYGGGDGDALANLCYNYPVTNFGSAFDWMKAHFINRDLYPMCLWQRHTYYDETGTLDESCDSVGVIFEPQELDWMAPIGSGTLTFPVHYDADTKLKPLYIFDFHSNPYKMGDSNVTFHKNSMAFFDASLLGPLPVSLSSTGNPFALSANREKIIAAVAASYDAKMSNLIEPYLLTDSVIPIPGSAVNPFGSTWFSGDEIHLFGRTADIFRMNYKTVY
jgi:hypothetical protein